MSLSFTAEKKIIDRPCFYFVKGYLRYEQKQLIGAKRKKNKQNLEMIIKNNVMSLILVIMS